MDEIKRAVQAAAKDLFNVEIDPELSRPDEQFGDYSTNVALQLAQKLGTNPSEIAGKIAAAISSINIAKTEVAGPGFINIWLTDELLVKELNKNVTQRNKDKEILVEFGDPNPFKEMHIGHLYSYIIGDAICSLLEATGATVRRLSYHGDVGLHVAKAIWAMQHEAYTPSNTSEASKSNIGWYYAKGAAAYDKDETARKQIDQINQKIYRHEPSMSKLYEQGKIWSFEDFDQILSTLNIKTDEKGRYLESQAAPIGVELVEQNIGKVFTKSEGAIVFNGEKVGLHTRVFITSKNLPTYEAKDLGLTELKHRDYPQANQSIIITANEQAEYFRVMLAALAEINPELAGKTKHMTHGFVSLSTGKMSSRTGEVYSAARLIKDVETAANKMQKNTNQDIQIGAIKYEFTKHRLGGDIAYDIAESISLEGNSGPYLQYAHARARSILTKAGEQPNSPTTNNFEKAERSLARKIGEYSEVVSRAVAELMPHHICTYLYELAQLFNRFYEDNRVVGHEREVIRLKLVNAYADTLRNGLNLLNISAPDRM